MDMWDRTARRIEADALDDVAGSRKLQSPAGRHFVHLLQGYHNERNDPLMPWLAREFRKGRVRARRPLEERLQNHPVGRGLPDDLKDALREYERYYVGAQPEPPVVPGANLPELYSELTANPATALLDYNRDPGMYLREPHDLWQEIRPGDLNHWADWYHQPDRRNVPLEQLKAHDLPAEVERYEREKAKRMKDEAVEEGRHQGEVVHSWPDGWTMRRLPAGKALDFEARHMRGDPNPGLDDGAPICVNWPQYQDAVGHGSTHIYSLRDPQGYPHVTTEIKPTVVPAPATERLERGLVAHQDLPPGVQEALRRYVATGEVPPDRPNIPDLAESVMNTATGSPVQYATGPEGGTITQIQGKGNSVAKPEYQARMKDWFATFPKETRPNWEWQEPDSIDRPEELHEYYRDPEAFWRQEEEYAGDHGGYGPHGDYGLLPPPRKPPEVNYEHYLDNHMVQSDRAGHAWWDPEDANALHQAAIDRGEIPQFAKAVEGFGQNQLENFHEWMMMQPPDANVPEFPADDDEDSPAMQQYYQDMSEWENEHPGVSSNSHLYDLLSPHYNQQTQQYENFVGDYGKFAPAEPEPKVASTSAPFRHLWVFSPQTGQVHLHDENGHHPAEVPTHESVAADLGETGLHHGYAYSIPGGWRVLDYHHAPVADPFVLRHVVEALRARA